MSGFLEIRLDSIKALVVFPTNQKDYHQVLSAAGGMRARREKLDVGALVLE